MTERKAVDQGPSGDGTTSDLQPGYRAYLVKDGTKFVIALPVAEYDPDAPSLTLGQIDGIRQIEQLYESSQPLAPVPAKRIRYDPFRAAQNTGPKRGVAGPSLSVLPGTDDVNE